MISGVCCLLVGEEGRNGDERERGNGRQMDFIFFSSPLVYFILCGRHRRPEALKSIKSPPFSSDGKGGLTSFQAMELVFVDSTFIEIYLSFT